MENIKRYFVQFMLKHGSVSVERALKYCEALSDGGVSDLNALKLLVVRINKGIAEQSFKIHFATCDVTGQELLVWINSKNDHISRLQKSYSAIELEYFHIIMQGLIDADDHKLPFNNVLNMTSSLTSHFTLENGQNVVNKWTSQGYFVASEGFVYLGPRLILEFTSHLKRACPEQDCKLCSELVFVIKRCSSCHSIYHSHCLEKYLTKQNRCPSCRNPWNTEFDAPTTSNATNGSVHSQPIDSFMMTDEE